ncbi:hypothetical protein PoB_000201600 [Plakobranchus ocellatus]|uniref:Uncharacterized protein n=1 Tax=Plakobranchus ocellatus TaxID=259542 RepID=A0AAV3XXG1_9GAST|nr:hypothetical protein PoB_000201600 [Plakobranchus ocellatus]
MWEVSEDVSTDDCYGDIGGTVASESALRYAGTLHSGFETHYRPFGLTEGLKPEITLLWTGYIQKTTYD